MKLNESGITLVMLVITVILIIILTSITVDLAIDGEIFNRAKETIFEQEMTLYLTQLEEYKQMHPNKTTKHPINVKNQDNPNYEQQMKTYIPSFDANKYGSIISIEDNELVCLGLEDSRLYIAEKLGIRTTVNIMKYYKELEWIESQGNQYIDTGIIGKTGVSAEIKMKNFNNSDVNILGSRRGNTRIYLAHIYRTFTIGYNNYYVSTMNYDNQEHIIRTSLKKNGQTMNIDGQDVISLNISQNIDTQLPMYAFAMNYDGTAAYKSYTRIYYMKIWEQNEAGEDVLVRDYIPVLRKSDNEIGMFDKVTNTFFENKGTLPFHSDYNKTKHPDIPNAYRKVEYIESSGEGQYINTGVNATSKLSSEIGVQLLEKGDVSICAARTGNTRLYLLHYFLGGYKIGIGNNYYGTTTKYESNYHKINTIVKNGNQQIIVDEKIDYTASLTRNIDIGLPLYIFAMNDNGNVRYPSKSRIYYIKIWEENNLEEDEMIRYFIPCYRKSDGEYGLYDTVTNTFFENQGTGIITGSE